MIHTERIPLFSLSVGWNIHEQARQNIFEAIVKCYRRSQMAGEEGRLFIIKQPVLSTHEVEVGLVRTDDAAQILGLQAFYAGAIRELSDEDIIELFKSA